MRRPRRPRADQSRPGRRGVVEAFFLAVLFLAPVKFGNPAAATQQAAFPIGGWEWLLQPWPGDLAILLGWAAGLAVAALDLGERRWARPGGAWIWFAAFVAWEIACAPFAESGPAWAAAVRWHGSAAAFLYGAASLARDPSSRRRMAGTVAAAVGWVAIVALHQRFGGIEATRRYAEEVFGPDGLPERLRSKLSSNRVWGTFVYPNALAGFLVVAVPVSGAFAVVARAPRRRLAAAAAAAAGVTALLLSGSKAGIGAGALATAGAVAASVTAGGDRARARRIRRAAWSAIFVVVAATIVVAAFVPRDRLQARVATLAARGEYWRAGIRLAVAHPVTGVGAGSFGIAYYREKEPGAEEVIYAHSMPVQAAAESGWPGAALYLLFVGAATVAVLRVAMIRDKTAGIPRSDPFAVAVASGIGAFLIHQWFDFDVEIPGIVFPAFALIGIATAMTAGAPSPAGSPGRRRWMRIAAIAVGAGGAVAVATSTARQLQVEHARRIADDLARDRPDAALRWARRATTAGPCVPLAWESRARVAEAAGDLDDALRSWRAAAQLEPGRARFHHHLAQVADRIPGHEEEAARARAAAARLYPTNPEYRGKTVNGGS